MKVVRFSDAGHVRAGVLVDDAVHDISRLMPEATGGAIGRLDPASVAAQVAEGAFPSRPLAEVHLEAPLTGIGKIVCIGLNYVDHAAETGADLPAEPVVFMKDPSTVVGPTDDLLIPRGATKTDWEIELGVVIGGTARYLDSPDDADAVIAGYVVSHDVSERAFQLERGGQWDKGKSCETFNPLGPYVVTRDEVADPQNVGLRLWVNGELRQDGNTATMAFPVRHIVWYLSQFMVLRPGDLINTGTPAGVALGRPDEPYLRPGDVIELEAEGLGRIRQTAVAAP